MQILSAGTGVFWPVPELLKKSFQACKAVFLQMALLTTLLYAPYFLLFRLLGVPMTGEASAAAGEAAAPGAIFIPAAMGVLLSLVHTLATARLVEKASQGELIGWREALHHAVKRLGAGILTGLLCLIILAGASLLLIVPGIILGVYYSLSVYAVSLKGRKGWDALNDSRNLVQGRWWAVLLRLALIGIISLTAAVIVNASFTLFRPVFISAGFLGVVPFLFQQLINSFSYTAMTLLFLNLDGMKSAAVARS